MNIQLYRSKFGIGFVLIFLAVGEHVVLRGQGPRPRERWFAWT
jgi:hypothetical protein